jgi:gliding motility-associated-like protein
LYQDLLMKKHILYLIFTCLLSCFYGNQVYATHLKGGEITVRRISDKTLTFEFTLTTYTENNRANQDQNDVYFCMGDGSPVIKAFRSAGKTIILPNSNGTVKNIYVLTYTYAAPSPAYRITAAIPNRNSDVKNMTNSVNTAFYVETIFDTNAGLGLNSTPILLNPAVDFAAVVGQRYIHNPNAFDVEGDSLSYELTFCKLGTQEVCSDRGKSVGGFRQPNEVGGQGTFTMNPTTGDLIWDAPTEVGLYNCAFLIIEWRNGKKISITTRDMQIEVKDADNKAPKLKIPLDICVEAGTLIDEIITAEDTPASKGRIDPISIRLSGGIFKADTVLIAPEYATFTPKVAQPQPSPASGRFRWQTDCVHIRQGTYDVLIKAEDAPPPAVNSPNLVDSKLWRIKVVAPRIQNLKTVGDAGNKTVTLTWDKYKCQNKNAEIIIYRKQGCTTFSPDKCTTGLPDGLGYVEVGRVPVSATTFTDKGVKRNTEFSYRAVVSFAPPTGGQSPVSNESCLTLVSQSPVLTNVTVDSTDVTKGRITVKWTRPIGLDKNQFKAPYQYRISRAVGLTGGTFVQVGTGIDTDLSGKTADTVLIDRGLNTQANAYRYKLDFYFTSASGLTLLDDETETATSVRLTTTADTRAVILNWTANVPWKNDNQKHRIYREIPSKKGTFNLIAEVAVQGPNTFTYKDSGKDTYAADGTIDLKMSPDSSYCYRVETIGTYNNPKIKPDLLSNFSQINCATPKSDIIPCPPALSIDIQDCKSLAPNADCNKTSFNNVLNWVNPTQQANGGDCEKEIVKYNIYYTPTLGGTFTKIGEVTSPKPPATTFTHEKKDSYAGCYYVTAVNRFDTESAKSNIVCKDNCPYFELPNVFTPNGDGKNDTFTPKKCPRAVESVTFTVYNRQGIKVFEYSGTDPNINWDGKTNDGKELPVGLYYYDGQVKFISLDPTNSKPQVLKGWIELIR